MRRSEPLRLRIVNLALALAVGCGAPNVSPLSDAGPTEDAPVAPDAWADVCTEPPCLRWELGPTLPERRSGHGAVIAHAGGATHLLVAGGVDVDLSNENDYRTASYRAVVNADGTLGAFEDWIALPTGLQPAAFSTIRNGSDEGILLIGGITASGGNVMTLVGMDGRAEWSRLGAMLDESILYSAGAPIGSSTAPRFALLGGLVGTGVTASAIATDGDAWSEAVALPGPRAMHAVARYDDHLYVLGGIVDDAATGARDVLRSVHDASGAVAGWQSVGVLDDPPFGAGAFVHEGALYVVGGADRMGPRNDVRRAVIADDGSVGGFVDVDAALPGAVSEGVTLVENGVVYVIGGRSTAQYRSTDRVFIGRFLGGE